MEQQKCDPKILLSALNAIDPATLDYQEWCNTGMALKYEGQPCEVWDEWSQRDSARYSPTGPNSCRNKWKSFDNSTSKPITGATIIAKAKEFGWSMASSGRCLEFDDIINTDDDDPVKAVPKVERTPAEELITYLETLFLPDDHVAYVVESLHDASKDKWVPAGKGSYDRTAQQLIDSLKRHPDDIGDTIGDWGKEAGAWIRFNPVDGDGVKNSNVTRFNYALVESDNLTIEKQEEAYRKYNLPVACLVNSGGKSLHAIVRVDAKDLNEYKERVEQLYKFLSDRGVPIDEQNKNASRLSRMPGVTRGDRKQKLIAVNIGYSSWDDWAESIGLKSKLPEPVTLDYIMRNPPKLPGVLIEGVLRRGHKMLIAGASKAGKSNLLMELALAIGEGRKWLGFQCEMGKVMYINLEIDPNSAAQRLLDIYQANGIPLEKANRNNVAIWSLRGHASPINELVPSIIEYSRDMCLDAVIVDPIYKVITGDENNASDMGKFCNEFDRIAEAGPAVIYCHHHSKGAQGAKRAMDRASGSGVFARDPDAQLDIIELEVTKDVKAMRQDRSCATGWRMESSLREFKNITPVNFWYDYPLHYLDEADGHGLETCAPAGSSEGNLSKSEKRSASVKDEKMQHFREAFVMNQDQANELGGVPINDIAASLGTTNRNVRDRVNKEMSDEFFIENSRVYEQPDTENG